MKSFLNQNGRISFKFLITEIENILKQLETIKNNINNNDHNFSKLIYGIEQHKIYVENMFNMLDGQIEWIPPKYTQCDFGKVYYSLEKEYMNACEESIFNIYKRLGEIHKNFHYIAEEIINTLKQKPESNINSLIFDLITQSKILVEQCNKFISSCMNKSGVKYSI